MSGSLDMLLSGGVPLNGAIMLTTKENDIDIDGQRFIRSGFFETDTAGLDSSVINLGVFYEKTGVTIPASFSNKRVVLGDNGTWIAYLNNDIWRSTDSGDTWTQITNVSSGTIEWMEYGGGSIWVICAAAQILRSTDDGLTWTARLNTTQNAMVACYSVVDGNWIAHERGTSGSSVDGKFWRSTDNGDTWNDVTPIGTTLDGVTILRPSSEDGNWYIAFQTGSTDGRVYKSSDGGATWVLMGSANVPFTTSRIIAFMYRSGAKVFGMSTDNFGKVIYELDPAGSSATDDAVIAARYYDAVNDPDLEWMGVVSNDSLDQNQVTNLNGVQYFWGGYATTDGVSFYRLDLANQESTVSQPACNSTQVWISRIDNLLNASTVMLSASVAGVAAGYSEGAAGQFVRIK
jgi:photosystem II stability/assembly factor-like uncharacterized protein